MSGYEPKCMILSIPDISPVKRLSASRTFILLLWTWELKERKQFVWSENRKSRKAVQTHVSQTLYSYPICPPAHYTGSIEEEPR